MDDADIAGYGLSTEQHAVLMCHPAYAELDGRTRSVGNAGYFAVNIYNTAKT